MDLKLLLGTFFLVFLAELGDKTQLTAFAFSGAARSPWTVFLGTSLALVAAAGLAVVAGTALAHYLPPKIVQIVSAVLFILIGVVLLLNMARKAPSGQTQQREEGEQSSVAEEQLHQYARESLLARAVLRQAAAFEDENAKLYADLAGKPQREPAEERLLRKLADEDRYHAERLRNLTTDEAQVPADMEFGQVHEQPPESPVSESVPTEAGRTSEGNSVTAGEQEWTETVNSAVAAEEAAADFYLALARSCHIHQLRDVLRWLSVEAVSHAQYLCSVVNHRVSDEERA